MRRLVTASKWLTIGLWLFGFWALLVPWACGDEVIRPGMSCPAGHRYEPLRLADSGAEGGARWVGLCYKGKDEKAAIARACSGLPCASAEGQVTLADSFNNPVDVCMTCTAEDRILNELYRIEDYLIWKEIYR